MSAHPPARPVYVDPGIPVWLDIEDGALVFRVAGKAARQVPLHWVSRLVLPEHAEMGLQAMCACARAGIPVVVMGETGEVVLRAVGHRPGEGDLRRRLSELVARPGWRGMLSDWVLSTRSRIGRIVQHRLSLGPGRLDAEEVAMAIERRARSLAGDDLARRSARDLQAFCQAWMHEVLLVHGIDGRTDEWLFDELDVASLLAGLMAFRLQPLRLGWLRRRHEWMRRKGTARAPVRYATLVRLFESNRGRVSRLGRDIINRFHRWLVEIA